MYSCVVFRLAFGCVHNPNLLLKHALTCRYPNEETSAGPTCTVDQLRVWRLQYGPGAELAYRHPEASAEYDSSKQDHLVSGNGKR
jgi:hypothetical protein